MRRLRDFQPVSLHVGAAVVEGRVAGIRGDEALVTTTGRWPAAAGFLPAHASLSFEHGGHQVVLQGDLHAGGDGGALRFIVGDGVRAADQRRHMRLSAALPVLVAPLDGAREAVGAHTVDISAGGMLVARGDLRGRLRVRVELPPSAALPHGRMVEAVGDVLRSDAQRTAVAFTHIDADDQLLLGRFVDDVRRALARRMQQI